MSSLSCSPLLCTIPATPISSPYTYTISSELLISPLKSPYQRTSDKIRYPLMGNLFPISSTSLNILPNTCSTISSMTSVSYCMKKSSALTHRLSLNLVPPPLEISDSYQTAIKSALHPVHSFTLDPISGHLVRLPIWVLDYWREIRCAMGYWHDWKKALV